MSFWDLVYPISISLSPPVTFPIRMSLSTLEYSDRLQIANHTHTQPELYNARCIHCLRAVCHGVCHN